MFIVHTKENAKLHSQLLAQTSIVEGLREERKLWGKELAHQGSLGKEREGEGKGREERRGGTSLGGWGGGWG